MSVSIDIAHELVFSELFAPAAQTTTVNGTGIDLSLQSPLTSAAILHVGTVTGTTPTLNVKIQDSADNSTFTDLATPLAFAQVTAAQAPVALQVDTRNVRRYVRAVATIAGTTPSFTFGVQLVTQKERF